MKEVCSIWKVESINDNVYKSTPLGYAYVDPRHMLKGEVIIADFDAVWKGVDSIDWREGGQGKYILVSGGNGYTKEEFKEYRSWVEYRPEPKMSYNECKEKLPYADFFMLKNDWKKA